MEDIPALVFPFGTPLRMAAAIALSENTHRAPNPITDLEAIEELARQGYGHEEIAHTLRIPLNVLDARMVLARLSTPMRQAVANGRIAVGVAQRIARLDSERMRDMEALLQTNGRVSGSDVRAAMQNRSDAAQAHIPDEVFGALPAAAETAADAMRGFVRAMADVSGENYPGRVFNETEPVETYEESMRLLVRRGAHTRDAIVRARLSIDDGLRVDVGGTQWRPMPEVESALEYQGEARVRARAVAVPDVEVARMVARWINGQQTTVSLARATGAETLPEVTVGGERWVRRRDATSANLFELDENGNPLVTAAQITHNGGSALVTTEEDENGLVTWMIGGREFVSRESIQALVEPEIRSLIAQDATADMEEGWTSVVTMLERAERLLPAAPDARSDHGFGLVMEALDYIRTLAREEANPPVALDAAAAALRAQERDIAERQRLAAERAGTIRQRAGR
jgi:hypothetical protein